jgi:hypothetical protein
MAMGSTGRRKSALGGWHMLSADRRTWCLRFLGIDMIHFAYFR